MRDSAADARQGGTARALRPVDAATLILVDDSDGPARILMGQRSSAHVFMAGKYVFPGGRVDVFDRKHAGQIRLPEATLHRLTRNVSKRFTEKSAGALTLAAIRETFEETGTLVAGRLADGADESYSAPFLRERFIPDPSCLVPFARAITPPGRPRRFDTRFFCAPASAIVERLPFEERPDKELERIGWFTLDEIKRFDLARITRLILADLEEQRRRDVWLDARGPMPFYRARQEHLLRDLI